GSVGGTYEVMLKFTEQEIRDHIRRYGVDIAGETIKEVAREMAAEQFSALAHQKIPAFEMPNGDVLYVEYNKDSDMLDVGQPTNAGLVAQHRFPYDHNIGLDANLQAVNEKLNELEEYRAELQEAEYSVGMRR
ncbi:MAG: DNA primase, partial [Alistipes putredinis]